MTRPPEDSALDFDPLLGRRVADKYVIEHRLGEGAMGAVYRAHREIAADPMYAARFHREAKAVSRLDHPNLIRVLDHGQEPDGLLYIAMEYLDGRDLFSEIEQEWPLSHARIVEILSQALSGLAEAHDSGVLHRDLKPENVMLLRKRGDDGSPVDSVKVCDFGIAKVAEEVDGTAASGGRKLTTAGLVMGTPGYMSPEQARGEACDARSDVYAVGVILYQLLTRRLPFDGKTPLDVVVKALHEQPPPPSSHGPSAAPGLEPVSLKAMSKRPEERYANAREMRAALRAAPVIEQKLLIASGDRPSLVNAPTQLDIGEASVSTGERAVAPVPSSSSRRWRWSAAFGGLAVTAIAAFAYATRRGPELQTQPRMSEAPPAPIVSATVAAVVTPVPTAEPVPVVAQAFPSAAPRATARTPARDVRPAVASGPAMPLVPMAPRPSSIDESAPPAPPPPPSPTATAIQAPTPTPPPPPTPSATPTASFNPATAHVELGPARTNNAAATGNDVSRALAPLVPRFTTCYRSALARATAASGATGTLHIESDDQGYVTIARVTTAAPAQAARCIEGLVARDVKINVDTGTANADVPLTFEPL